MTLDRSTVWEECSTCHGSGHQYRDTKKGRVEEACHWCVGSGEQLTDFGNAIADLIQRSK